MSRELELVRKLLAERVLPYVSDPGLRAFLEREELYDLYDVHAVNKGTAPDEVAGHCLRDLTTMAPDDRDSKWRLVDSLPDEVGVDPEEWRLKDV